MKQLIETYPEIKPDTTQSEYEGRTYHEADGWSFECDYIVMQTAEHDSGNYFNEPQTNVVNVTVAMMNHKIYKDGEEISWSQVNKQNEEELLDKVYNLIMDNY